MIEFEEPFTANVGTEGVNENFLFWKLFEFCDQIPHILLSFAQIAFVYRPIFQNNSCAISDRARTAKIYVFRLSDRGGLV